MRWVSVIDQVEGTLQIPEVGSKDIDNIAKSRDNKFLLIRVNRNSIVAYNIETEEAKVFNHVPSIYYMRYIADINPQHTRLLIACASSLVIFDFETGDIIHNIDTGLETIRTAEFNPLTGEEILVTYNSKEILIYDPDTAQVITTFGEDQETEEGATSNLHLVASWSNDGTKIAAGGSYIPLRIWERSSETIVKELQREFRKRRTYVSGLQWSEDDTFIMIDDSPSAGDMSVQVWDVDKEEMVFQRDGRDWTELISDDGKFIGVSVSYSTGEILYVYDVFSGVLVAEVNAPPETNVRGYCWIEDTLYIGGPGNEVNHFDLSEVDPIKQPEGDTRLQSIQDLTPVLGYPSLIEYVWGSEHGTYLIAGTKTKGFKILEWESGEYVEKDHDVIHQTLKDDNWDPSNTHIWMSKNENILGLVTKYWEQDPEEFHLKFLIFEKKSSQGLFEHALEVDLEGISQEEFQDRIGVDFGVDGEYMILTSSESSYVFVKEGSEYRQILEARDIIGDHIPGLENLAGVTFLDGETIMAYNLEITVDPENPPDPENPDTPELQANYYKLNLETLVNEGTDDPIKITEFRDKVLANTLPLGDKTYFVLIDLLTMEVETWVWENGEFSKEGSLLEGAPMIVVAYSGDRRKVVGVGMDINTGTVNLVVYDLDTKETYDITHLLPDPDYPHSHEVNLSWFGNSVYMGDYYNYRNRYEDPAFMTLDGTTDEWARDNLFDGIFPLWWIRLGQVVLVPGEGLQAYFYNDGEDDLPELNRPELEEPQEGPPSRSRAKSLVIPLGLDVGVYVIQEGG